MRIVNSPESQVAHVAPILRGLPVLAAGLVLFAAPAGPFAQTPTDQTAAHVTPSIQRPIHSHKRPSPAHQTVAPVQDVPAPVPPPEPEKPNWPAFDQPGQASVIWDSHGLRIDAANSSLQQILKDVSTATGVKIDGATSDQRVFGNYGPGQARDVLSQLLQGSGYNVMMIGDQGQGTPRQVLLTTRQSGASTSPTRPNQPSSDDDDNEEPPPQPEPEQQVRPAFPPGTPPRSPQQIMQEMQQRQQQIQQSQPPQPVLPPQPQF